MILGEGTHKGKGIHQVYLDGKHHLRQDLLQQNSCGHAIAVSAENDQNHRRSPPPSSLFIRCYMPRSLLCGLNVTRICPFLWLFLLISVLCHCKLIAHELYSGCLKKTQAKERNILFSNCRKDELHLAVQNNKNNH